MASTPASEETTVTRATVDCIQYHTDYDVLWSKKEAKALKSHKGNEFLHNLVVAQLTTFSESPNKAGRAYIAKNIMDTVKRKNGRFLKQEENITNQTHPVWVQMPEKKAIEYIISIFNTVRQQRATVLTGIPSTLATFQNNGQSVPRTSNQGNTMINHMDSSQRNIASDTIAPVLADSKTLLDKEKMMMKTEIERLHSEVKRLQTQMDDERKRIDCDRKRLMDQIDDAKIRLDDERKRMIEQVENERRRVDDERKRMLDHIDNDKKRMDQERKRMMEQIDIERKEIDEERKRLMEEADQRRSRKRLRGNVDDLNEEEHAKNTTNGEKTAVEP